MQPIDFINRAVAHFGNPVSKVPNFSFNLYRNRSKFSIEWMDEGGQRFLIDNESGHPKKYRVRNPKENLVYIDWVLLNVFNINPAECRYIL